MKIIRLDLHLYENKQGELTHQLFPAENKDNHDKNDGKYFIALPMNDDDIIVSIKAVFDDTVTIQQARKWIWQWLESGATMKNWYGEIMPVWEMLEFKDWVEWV